MSAMKTQREAQLETIRRAEEIVRATHGADDVAGELYALGLELGRDTTYNGWANYPTWAVNLWLSNDRGTYEEALEVARAHYTDAAECIQVRDGIWTLEQARRFNVADAMREWLEELAKMAKPEDAEPTMFDDLMGYALGQVNWHEIADAWIESLEELEAYEG